MKRDTYEFVFGFIGSRYHATIIANTLATIMNRLEDTLSKGTEEYDNLGLLVVKAWGEEAESEVKLQYDGERLYEDTYDSEKGDLGEEIYDDEDGFGEQGKMTEELWANLMKEIGINPINGRLS